MLHTSHKNNDTLTFDDVKHVYRLNNEVVPGCTTVNSQGYPESFFLTNWKIDQGVKGLLALLEREGQHPKDLNPERKLELVKEAKGVARRKATAMANVGTLLHDYAYQFEILGRVNEGLRKSILESPDLEKALACIKSFRRYHRKHTSKLISAESIVASPTYRFAGKFDKLSSDGKDVILTDYKTSSGIYADQLVQLGGYSIAIKEWFDITVTAIEILRFGKDGSFETLYETNVKPFQEQFLRNLSTMRFRKEYEK